MKTTTKSLLALIAAVTVSSVTSSQAQSWFDIFRPSKAVERQAEPRRGDAYRYPVAEQTRRGDMDRTCATPVVAPPVYVDQFGPRIKVIDKMAHSMLTNYGKEIVDIRGCDYSMALHGEMKNYCVKVRKLMKANEGKSKKEFNIAVCDVRDSLVKINKLHKRAIVSQHVCNLIEKSDRPVSFVVDNRNDFLGRTFAAR